MALVKFELKEEHIKLLRHFKWAIDEDNSVFCETENKTPYGGLSLIEDAGLILFGKPNEEFDPLSAYGAQYSDEQQIEIEELYDELPMALDIINYNRSFETGHFKTKWHTREWKKFTPK